MSRGLGDVYKRQGEDRHDRVGAHDDVEPVSDFVDEGTEREMTDDRRDLEHQLVWEVLGVEDLEAIEEGVDTDDGEGGVHEGLGREDLDLDAAFRGCRSEQADGGLAHERAAGDGVDDGAAGVGGEHPLDDAPVDVGVLFGGLVEVVARLDRSAGGQLLTGGVLDGSEHDVRRLVLQ